MREFNKLQELVKGKVDSTDGQAMERLQQDAGDQLKYHEKMIKDLQTFEKKTEQELDFRPT